MTEDSPKPPRTSPDDAEIEREIRRGRKFSVAEALGRKAGDLLKGTSPVTLKRQAELELEHYLEGSLEDSEGTLLVVLQRVVLESENLLEAGYEDPLDALQDVVGSLLSSESRLRRFVTAIDAEWGRMYSERPYFEREGQPPRPRDPYTVASVRAQLEQLLRELTGEAQGP